MQSFSTRLVAGRRRLALRLLLRLLLRLRLSHRAARPANASERELRRYGLSEVAGKAHGVIGLSRLGRRWHRLPRCGRRHRQGSVGLLVSCNTPRGACPQALGIGARRACYDARGLTRIGGTFPCQAHSTAYRSTWDWRSCSLCLCSPSGSSAAARTARRHAPRAGVWAARCSSSPQCSASCRSRCRSCSGSRSSDRRGQRGVRMQRSLCMARRAIGAMALGCAFLAPPSGALGPAPARAETTDRDLAAKIAVYRQKLAAYKKARGAFDRRAAPYWHRISEKRGQRRSKLAHNRPLTLNDYVLEQPPLYTGPPEPQNRKRRRASRSPSRTSPIFCSTPGSSSASRRRRRRPRPPTSALTPERRPLRASRSGNASKSTASSSAATAPTTSKRDASIAELRASSPPRSATTSSSPRTASSSSPRPARRSWRPCAARLSALAARGALTSKPRSPCSPR